VKQKITADDCRACGACCVAATDGGDVEAHGYADMSPKDVARVSSHVHRQLLKIHVGGETYYSTKAKKLPTGHHACQYLRGTPTDRCSCSIYDTRPDVCRHFRVGGSVCKDARRAMNLDLPKKEAGYA